MPKRKSAYLEAANGGLGHELRLSDLIAGSLDESIYPDWIVARLVPTSLPTSTVKSLNYVFHFGTHDREALPLNASAEKLAMPKVRALNVITTDVPVIEEMRHHAPAAHGNEDVLSLQCDIAKTLPCRTIHRQFVIRYSSHKNWTTATTKCRRSSCAHNGYGPDHLRK